MKRFLRFALCLLALPAAAQPVSDLYEAISAVRQQQRDMEPALALARETQAALKTMTTIQLSLQGATGTTPLDKAVEIIDNYNADLVQRRAFLPRDVTALVTRARKMLDDPRVGPPPGDLQPLRDRFHHVVVAAMERRVLQDAEQLTSLTQAYEGISNLLRALQGRAIALAGAASQEPGKPQ
jgi:hypothetical protein